MSNKRFQDELSDLILEWSHTLAKKTQHKKEKDTLHKCYTSLRNIYLKYKNDNPNCGMSCIHFPVCKLEDCRGRYLLEE